MQQMRINDIYAVTIDGDVTNTKTGRVLKPFTERTGYKVLRMGKGKKHYIHRLVATAFLPAPTAEGCVVDHVDRNKLNNHASNLRWVSRSENSRNINIDVKPRPNNAGGEHHITITRCNSYVVRITNIDMKHYSTHKTMEEAIKKRDSIISNV